MVVAKELNTVELKSFERGLIASTVIFGIVNGSIGNLEWELEKEFAGDLLGLSNEISRGRLKGTGWSLTLKRYTPLQF